MGGPDDCYSARRPGCLNEPLLKEQSELIQVRKDSEDRLKQPSGALGVTHP